MAQTKTKRSPKRAVAQVRYADRFAEADSTYFLKLVIVVLLSTLWLKFVTPFSWNGIPVGAFPLGALIALVGIRLLEKNPIDRKIWFAVLVIVTIISYFVPAGIVI